MTSSFVLFFVEKVGVNVCLCILDLLAAMANTQPTGEASSSSQSSSNLKQPIGMNNPFQSMMQGPMSATTSGGPLTPPLSSSVSQSSFANGIQGNGQPNGHLMPGMQYGPIEQLISTFGSSSPSLTPASSSPSASSSLSTSSGISGKTIDEHDATGNVRRKRQISALESFFTSGSNPIDQSNSNSDASSMDRTHKGKGKCA